MLTCKLASSELQLRKAGVIANLKKNIIERSELSDGFRYKFNYADDMMDELNSFIKTERLCCDFFDFKLEVVHNGFIFLTVSGERGAKDFIESELQM